MWRKDTQSVLAIASVQFAACTSAGIESAQANAPLKVFPNPTNNIVNVELERAAVGTLALFDLNGNFNRSLTYWFTSKGATSYRSGKKCEHAKYPCQGVYL